MQFDYEAMPPMDRNKLLLATVLPRPIAWITSRDRTGVINVAPFSFFNAFGSDPATVGVGSRAPAQREHLLISKAPA
jgi:flavin reductase (DIM6/NTAB) family NADH-FMN oxidoreductase RutF